MMNSNGTAWADGSAFPTRFGLWVWANGVTPSRFVPSSSGEGAAWELSEQLAPLAAVKHRLAVPSGFEARAVNSIPHLSGFGALLTGKAQIGEEGANTFAGPTIDQIIAAQIGGATPYRSIEAGAWFTNALSYNGPYNPNPPETVPHVLFERLFGPTFRAPGEDGGRIDPRLGLRRSVLDAVGNRVTALQSEMSAADKIRFDQHLELSLSQLGGHVEGVKRLGVVGGHGDAHVPRQSCQPFEPRGPDRRIGDENIVAHLRHHLGIGSIERCRRAVEVTGQLGQSPIRSQQSARGESGDQHAANDQHTLGYHQAPPGGQVRPAIDAVEIAKVVESRVGGVGDVDHAGAVHLARLR
jgi:hypothetical protein